MLVHHFVSGVLDKKIKTLKLERPFSGRERCAINIRLLLVVYNEKQPFFVQKMRPVWEL